MTVLELIATLNEMLEREIIDQFEELNEENIKKIIEYIKYVKE